MNIDRMEGRGGIFVGTPDDAIARIKELQQATGGFGGILGLAHEWTTREKTLRSHELFARYAAPQFQGQLAAALNTPHQTPPSTPHLLPRTPPPAPPTPTPPHPH